MPRSLARNAKLLLISACTLLAWPALAEIPDVQSADGQKAGPVPDERPNLILLMVDDLSFFEMQYSFGRALGDGSNAFDTYFTDQGATFPQFFNTTPLCCPSRASYLTGRYAHNHGVYGNNYNLAGGNGGWRGFREQGNEEENIGPWLSDAGYYTGLIGKYMNGYPNIPGGFVPENYIPLGWDEWYGSFTNDFPFSYFDFRVNENGSVNTYDDGTYLTDLETTLAVDFLTRAAALEEPFFLFLSPYAPHGPTEPATRYDGVHQAAGVTTAVPPSFNEFDMSDKPLYIQQDAELQSAHFPNGALRKLDMTLSVDDMIQAVIDTLSMTGELDNTYIFFVSDNGLLWGEHRLGGKAAPYEESIRIPMAVRGPTVPAGTTFNHLVANIDLAPTLLELAEAPLPAVVDGESFVRAFEGMVGPAAWRDALQIEILVDNPNGNQPVVIQPYSGIRSRRYCLFDHQTPEMDREVYDLDLDPFQERSQHGDPDGPLEQMLTAARQDLDACAGQACRDATRRGWPRPAFQGSCTGLTCDFDASISRDPDGTITDYNWDFGDGNVGAGLTVSHTYAAGGFFAVDLVITDNDGQVNGFATEIIVDALFVDGFESGDLSGWDETIP